MNSFIVKLQVSFTNLTKWESAGGFYTMQRPNETVPDCDYLSEEVRRCDLEKRDREHDNTQTNPDYIALTARFASYTGNKNNMKM